MIIVFEIRDEVFSHEQQIEAMVHLSPPWTVCDRWVWRPGTIEDNGMLNTITEEDKTLLADDGDTTTEGNNDCT